MKSIKEILTDLSNILMRMSILNFKSMTICQKLGFNGFKRWHRCYAKELFDKSICLEIKAFDYYSVMLEPNPEAIDYDAKSLIYHFQSYREYAEKSLSEIGSLNKEFYEVTGFEAPIVCEVKCILLKQIEKCNRMVARYKSIGSEATGLHDLHVYDDELHKKMKEKEVKHYEQY
jgi:hypothetical protein